MKTQTRNLLFLLLIISLIATVNGCKKNNNSDQTDPTGPHTMQPVLDAFRAKLKDQPTSFTRILNLQGKGFWADENGNQITRRSFGTSTGRVNACPDPGEDYPSQNIHSVLREYTCGQGFRIEVTYDVTLAYTPMLTNSSNLPSFGRVWLFNSSGTRIWPTTTPLPKHNVLTITNVGSAGTDPNGLPLTIYRINFRTDYIPEATFNASTSMQTYLSVYTDCPNYPTFVCPFSNQQSDITSQQNSYPCTRIDNVYWNPSMGIGASVAGVNTVPSDCIPPGYVYPEQQEIQIFAGGSWQPVRLWRYGGSFKEYNYTGSINNFDVWYILMDGYSSSSGTITLSNANYPIRYRNKMVTTNAGGPCVTQPDGTWVTTTWYISLY